MPTNPIRFWYRRIKRDIYTFYYLLTDPMTPSHYKILPLMIFWIYLITPFDLIPDFIPFLGYVDDSAFLLLGLGFMYRLIPSEIFERNQKKAEEKMRSSYLLEGILIIFILFVLSLGIILIVLIQSLFNI